MNNNNNNNKLVLKFWPYFVIFAACLAIFVLPCNQWNFVFEDY